MYISDDSTWAAVSDTSGTYCGRVPRDEDWAVVSLWCEGVRAGRYVHLVAAKSAELVEVKVAQPTALCAPLQGFSASSDELKFANVRAWENCCSLCRRVPGAVAWVFVGACQSCSDPYA